MTYHKAWAVRRHRLDSSRIHVLAETAGKAKGHVWKSEYREGDDNYLEYTCHRVPALDYDDEAQPGEPHEEPLTFFSVWKAGLMHVNCHVCDAIIRSNNSSQWSNPWTAFCVEHFQYGEPYPRHTQDWYQPVYPDAPMVWVGDDE